MTARAVAEAVVAAGARIYARDGDLKLRPGRLISPALLSAVRAHKAELLKIVPEDPDAPLPAKFPDWKYGECFDCGTALPDGIEIALCQNCRRSRNPEAVDFSSLSPLSDDGCFAKSSGATWVVSSAHPGDVRLIVATHPPWPDTLYRAAALVEVIYHHHRAGNDGAVRTASEQLELMLAALRGEGIETWLSS